MSTLDPGQQIIHPRLIEPAEILKVLQNYVQAKPDSSAWRDFYAGGAGQTLLELISGLAGFDSYNALAARRESSLDNAVLETSVREHAFNRGILGGPTDTLELRLNVSVAPGTSVTVTRGQMVGMIGDYELRSLENKSATSAFTLDVAAGFLHTQTRNIEPKPFARWTFALDQRFISPSLETLRVDGEEIPLRSELNFLEKYNGDFMLRRVIPGEVRIYVGNGVLGWLDRGARSLEYTYLSYGPELASNVRERPELVLSNANISTYTVLRSPTFGIDKEELRGLAVYFPLDGRIVQDKDYDALILKYFGGVLHDVYSYNTDPNQQVVMLIDSNYVSDTHLPQIRSLVDSKRGTGINVLYSTRAVSEGVVVSLDLRVDDYSFYLATRERVIDYLNRNIRKFMRVPTVIRTKDIAVELTERFGQRFYSRVDNTYTLQPFDFIQAYNIQVNL